MGCEGLEHGGVEVAAGRTDGVPGRDDARTLTQPMSMAFIRATSSSRPPVCTKSPRLRTVVKPARRVRRALTTPRRVLRAGSSWTGTSGLAWSGPPMTQVDLHVHEPREHGHIPEVDRRGVLGDRRGGDRAMRSLSTSSPPGSTSRLPVRSSIRALTRWTGGRGVVGRAMYGSSRGGSSVFQPVANRFPADATRVTVAKCREPARALGGGERRRHVPPSSLVPTPSRGRIRFSPDC